MLALGVAGWFAWQELGSPTRVALFNVEPSALADLAGSSDGIAIELLAIEREDLLDADLDGYDAVLMQMHAVRLEEDEKEHIQSAAAAGLPVVSFGATDPASEITSIQGGDLELLSSAWKHGGERNRRTLLSALRRLDGKTFNAGDEAPIEEHASDGMFHIGEQNTFASFEDYRAFYEASSHHTPGGPKVALYTGFLSPYDPSTRAQFDAVISDLEARGVNVYPVFGFTQRLDFLHAIEPDLVLHFAHGRFVFRGTEAFLAYAEELNAPMLTPLVVFEKEEEWLADRQGLDGGMLGQSVVVPEFDGGIVPFVVGAYQSDERGFDAVYAIPERVAALGDKAEGWLDLQTTPNADKKVVVLYYKGAGDNAMVASSLEVAPSLYGMLERLHAEGYSVGELPDRQAFEDRLAEEGMVLGTYAQGSFEEFVAAADPEFVPVETYLQWAGQEIAGERWAEVERDHGLAPGQHMAIDDDRGLGLAISRSQFGNVVFMPVPATGEGQYGEAVHGQDGSPAHPYVAAYLWARLGFEADALVHVGTHGSVEFLPGKQLAQSHLDWTEALMGDVPHLYLYDVSNPGEAMIAKRRSLAVMNNHLTAPYMEADLYDGLSSVDAKVHKLLYSGGVSEALKDELVSSVTREVEALHLDIDLDEDPEDLEAWAHELSAHLHELEQAKVPRGRYVLGRAWSEDEITETVQLTMIDRVGDARADLALYDGQLDIQDRTDHIVLERYREAALKDIDRLLAGTARPEELVPPEHLATLTAWQEAQAVLSAARHQGARDVASGTPEDKVARALSEDHAASLFRVMKPGLAKDLAGAGLQDLETLDDHLGFYLQHSYVAESVGDAGADGQAMAAILGSESAMEQVAEARARVQTAVSVRKQAQQRCVDATRDLLEALEGVLPMQAALRESTQAELDSLINGLDGGYIAAGPGGDPIGNPSGVPTGRNLVGLDVDSLPGEEAWSLGQRMADEVIETWAAEHGEPPTKVALTFWSSELLRAEGVQVAQALALLGVEPVRNRYGKVRELRLIPREELGRPRVDIVVQTSGQFRDLAASRIYLLNDAVALASMSEEDDNPVRAGSVAMEASMKEAGVSPVEARDLSTVRVFGGINGSYGASIMGLVESGDRWDDDRVIAQTYLRTMGTMYDEDHWEEPVPGAFEGALTGTQLVLQPRTSNLYGPLNLDHVYEFMGGISAASREVNGEDPEAWFNDMRRRSRLRVQPAKQAIWVEARTTVHHPTWLAEQMEEGATALEDIAEVTRDIYGWNAMKPAEIDDELWDEHHQVYVRDRHGLGVREHFEETNPAALQEVSAVMLETARKGMWEADEQQLAELVDLHVELVTEHGAGCSGFVCDNPKLREYIASRADPALREPYEAALDAAREGGGGPVREGMKLEREEISASVSAEDLLENKTGLAVVLGLAAMLGAGVMVGARRKG
ncbi:MAG: cobaltochelatase subunit CobN [Proteobacteria bacterium]|nr:cobaltochelatase subunit CobN [Pseudomonadota bacterium]MCP4918494.1 cobaltochelatase subunit CobN [Pseudomonadota bacterium]